MRAASFRNQKSNLIASMIAVLPMRVFVIVCDAHFFGLTSSIVEVLLNYEQTTNWRLF